MPDQAPGGATRTFGSFTPGQAVTDAEGRGRIVRSVLPDGNVELEPFDEALAAGTEGLIGLPPPIPESARRQVAAATPPPPAVRPEIGTGRPLTRQTPRSPREQLRVPLAQADPKPSPTQLATAVARGFDPRTPEGRRNIAGTAGEVGAAYLVGGPVIGTAATMRRAVTFSRIVATTTGATLGGAAEAGVEALVRFPEAGEPPPGRSPVEQALLGGAEQGAYSLLGSALAWPIKAIGKRVLGTKIGAEAFESLKATRRETLNTMRGTMQRIQQQVRVLRRRFGELGRRGREQVEAGREAVREGLISMRPSAGAPTRAGEAVGGVVARQPAGPVQTLRQQLGQVVEEAAETGPDVSIAELKASAQEMVERQLRPQAEAFPRARPEPPEGMEVLEQALGGMPPGDPRALALQDEISDIMRAAGVAEQQSVINHPAMGVLSRILNAGDEVTFAAAHAFKRDLDEAMKVPFEQSAKKRVDSMTRGVRTQLRQILRVHEPYNAATAAFADIEQLFRRADVRKIRATVLTEPAAVVRLVGSNEPAKLTAIRDLLLTEAPRGGGAAEGQAAWDAFRGAWVDENIIKAGPEGLGQRLAGLDDEFRGVLFGDDVGQAVLNNLAQLDQAFATVTRQGTQRLAALEREGARRIEQRGQPAEAISVRLRDPEFLRTFLDPIEELRKSTVSARRPIEAVGADAARALMLGPTQIWGAISTMRLMRGPKGSDIMRWAARSKTGTQLWTRALLGPSPGAAMSIILRTPGIGAYLIDPEEHDLDEFLEAQEDGAPPTARVNPGVLQDPSLGVSPPPTARPAAQ